MNAPAAITGHQPLSTPSPSASPATADQSIANMNRASLASDISTGDHMNQKVMLEVTQPVVSGNEVAVHSGELFEPGAKLPEGVTVRPVIVPGPDPAPEAPAPEPEPEPEQKPAAKAPAKAPAK